MVSTSRRSVPIVSRVFARRLSVAPWTPFPALGPANREEKLASERVAKFGKRNAMSGDAVEIPSSRESEKGN
jgi:hypothetical protein